MKLRIIWGLEDECLMDIIDTINNFRVKSDSDHEILSLAWDRLDLLTSP